MIQDTIYRKKVKILVWDIPTRVFHWLLVATFVIAFLTSESEKLRDWHMVFGYLMVGLIIFRLIWGLIGTKYARFSDFVQGPNSVITYVKGVFKRDSLHYIGHNPAGAIAIILLLTCGLGMGLTGWLLFNDLGGWFIEEAHEALSSLMLGIVIAHVAGVLVSSLLHNENLVKSMVSGYKFGNINQGIKHKHSAIGLFLFVLFIYVAYLLFSGAFPILMP